MSVAKPAWWRRRLSGRTTPRLDRNGNLVDRRPRPGTGQAFLTLVLGMVLLLTLGAGVLAATAVNHDPLIQTDQLDHLAYRALEAGVNSYLSAANTYPNLVDCTKQNYGTGNCNYTQADQYGQWTSVTVPTGGVPEYYIWGNPNLNAPSTQFTTGNTIVAQVQIIGAAGYPGHFAYATSVANFDPTNGYLTHVFWSNYEAIDPTIEASEGTTCTYDNYNWNENYDTTGDCSPVSFAEGDTLIGPVFSNDSIFVLGDPSYGSSSGSPAPGPSPVYTADTGCLFVDSGAGDGSPTACLKLDGGSGSNGPYYDAADSAYNQPVESDASANSDLPTLAAEGGCLYQGPTTFSFYESSSGTPLMNVTSEDTTSQADGKTCTGSGITIPNQGNGNGILYVEDAPDGSCVTGANPYDNGYTLNGTTYYAQIASGTENYDFANDLDATTPGPDCEGTAFVRDAVNVPTGDVTGVSGTLTVGAADDIVIDGNITYADCGSSFASTYADSCAVPGTNKAGTSINDGLGLIAENNVEVNRPAETIATVNGTANSSTCTTTNGTTTCSPGYIAPECTTSGTNAQTDFQAALCDPASGTWPNATVVIDAAILAVDHSFLVNQWDNSQSGGQEGTLYVYGSVDQNYRGGVGTGTLNNNGSVTFDSGYAKYYTWDDRIQWVGLPGYLAPGTPSWTLATAATFVPQAVTCSDGVPDLSVASNLTGSAAIGCPSVP